MRLRFVREGVRFVLSLLRTCMYLALIPAASIDRTAPDLSSIQSPIASFLFCPRTVSRRKKGAAEAKLNRLKEDFLEEIKLLSKLRHPCITAFMGAIVTSVRPHKHMRRETNVLAVLTCAN